MKPFCPGHLPTALRALDSQGEAVTGPQGAAGVKPTGHAGSSPRDTPYQHCSKLGPCKQGSRALCPPGASPHPLHPWAPPITLRPEVPQAPRTPRASPGPPALMHPGAPPAPQASLNLPHACIPGGSRTLCTPVSPPRPQARFYPGVPVSAPPPSPAMVRPAEPGPREGTRAAPLTVAGGARGPARRPLPPPRAMAAEGQRLLPPRRSLPWAGAGPTAAVQNHRPPAPLQPIRAASCLPAHLSERIPGPGSGMRRRVRLSGEGKGRGGGASAHSAAADSSPHGPGSP